MGASPAAGVAATATDASEVRLQIPASARYLRLARLTASGFVVDLDFGIDAVEALRVAVDELAAAVIDGCEPTDVLELSFRVDGDAVLVEGTCRTEAGPAVELHSVARSLLDLLADEYGFDDGTGAGPAVLEARRFWLRKRSGGGL